MVKRALCVAVGLLGALLPAVAQQPHHSTKHEQLRSAGASNASLSLNLYRPKVWGAAESSLLLHNGSVPLWLDGPGLNNGIGGPSYGFASSWVQLGFTSADFLPAALLERCPATGTKAECWPGPWYGWKGSWGRRKRFARRDAKLIRESDLFRWRSGLLIRPMEREGWRRYVGEHIVEGTVGNDKFQITAGASYDEWNANGRSVRFRSFAAPR